MKLELTQTENGWYRVLLQTSKECKYRIYPPTLKGAMSATNYYNRLRYTSQNLN